MVSIPFLRHLLLAWAVIASVADADSPPREMLSIHSRQQLATIECHLTVPTDAWTTCQQILDRYRLSLDVFHKYNPSINADCGGYVPGQSYCVSAGQSDSLHDSLTEGGRETDVRSIRNTTTRFDNWALRCTGQLDEQLYRVNIWELL